VGIRKISAWAEPEQIHMLKTVDCEHESRALKKAQTWAMARRPLGFSGVIADLVFAQIGAGA